MNKKIIFGLLCLLSIILATMIYLSFEIAGSPKKIIPVSLFPGKGQNPKGFGCPGDFWIKDNYLYVGDICNSRIQVFEINSQDGSVSPKFAFGKEGEKLGEFKIPDSLAIKDDYLYIADTLKGRIQVFEINSQDGSISPKFAFGKEGEKLGEFGLISMDLAIKDNYLYIADSANSRIQVFEINSQDGSISPKFAFGKEGKELGEFGRFSGGIQVPGFLNLAIKNKWLYVVDSGNSRIQVFEINSQDGSISPKFAFGKEGEKLGEFKIPDSLAIKDDYLYITDLANRRIQVLKIHPKNGSISPKFAFGKEGKELGEFNMPQGLAIKDKYLYVADSGNRRVQVFEIQK